MKKLHYKTKSKCLLFFLITILGTVLMIPSKVYSAIDPVTALAIAAAIGLASETGVFR